MPCPTLATILPRVDGERRARVVFGATSALVTFGLVLQLTLSITDDRDAGFFTDTPDRIVNFFSYFTVLANILVAVTTGMLAADPGRARSTAFRVLRLNGVVGIAVTGVVFHTTLADLQELTGWPWVADHLLHTASPILTVAGWLLVGPRGLMSRAVVGLAVIVPIAWLAYALVRGELVDDRFGEPFYPYPFLDVAGLGYPVVLVNAAVVAVLFLAISFGALALDRRLPGLRASPARPAAPAPAPAA